MGLHPYVVVGLTTAGMWVGGAGPPNQSVPHARAVGPLEGQVGFLQNWLTDPGSGGWSGLVGLGPSTAVYLAQGGWG